MASDALCDADYEGPEGCAACTAPPTKGPRCCALCVSTGEQCKRSAKYPQAQGTAMSYCKQHWGDCNSSHIETYRSVCRQQLTKQKWVKKLIHEVNPEWSRAESLQGLRPRLLQLLNSGYTLQDMKHVRDLARECYLSKREFQMSCVVGDQCGWPGHEDFTFKVGNFQRGLTSFLAEQYRGLQKVDEAKHQEQDMAEEDLHVEIVRKRRLNREERRQAAVADMQRKCLGDTDDYEDQLSTYFNKFNTIASQTSMEIQKRKQGMDQSEIITQIAVPADDPLRALTTFKDLSFMLGSTKYSMNAIREEMRRQIHVLLSLGIIGSPMMPGVVEEALVTGISIPELKGLLQRDLMFGGLTDRQWADRYFGLNFLVNKTNALIRVSGSKKVKLLPPLQQEILLGGRIYRRTCHNCKTSPPQLLMCPCTYAFYCSKSCQLAARKTHKVDCKKYIAIMTQIRKNIAG